MVSSPVMINCRHGCQWFIGTAVIHDTIRWKPASGSLQHNGTEEFRSRQISSALQSNFGVRTYIPSATRRDGFASHCFNCPCYDLKLLLLFSSWARLEKASQPLDSRGWQVEGPTAERPAHSRLSLRLAVSDGVRGKDGRGC